MQINLIAAVGISGQIGLNGKMPWAKDTEDLAYFRDQTEGHAVVMGAVTFDALFESQPVWSNRLMLRMSYDKTTIFDQGKVIGFWKPGPVRIISELDSKVEKLWVAGGAQTYAVWMDYIRRMHITRVQYNGEADAWMPHPWTRPF